MLYERTIHKEVVARLGKGKAVVLYGARQVGKTTLSRLIAKEYAGEDFVYLSCDEPTVRERLTGASSLALRAYIGTAKLVVIDEAQRVPDIGIVIKLLVDNYPDLQVIATGSSSFELANIISEPLTGRAYTFRLYPLSIEEINVAVGVPHLDATLEQRLVFGNYPAIVNVSEADAAAELGTISTDFLYKDLLAYDGIRKPELLEKLLRLLASQTGSLVSYSELANTLDVAKQTVENYIRILEQAFIIFSLTPFSRNLRSELTKKRKIYFYDTGIRNAVLGNLAPVVSRGDVGALWENFVIAERLKQNQNAQKLTKLHFWRTHDGQEVDLVEEEGDLLRAFEIKWKAQTSRTPTAWLQAYPDIPVRYITRVSLLPLIDDTERAI